MISTPTTTSTYSLLKYRQQTPEMYHVSSPPRRYARARVTTCQATRWQKLCQRSTTPNRGQDGRAHDRSRAPEPSCFSSPVLFRLRDVSHHRASLCLDAIEKAPDGLRAQTSTLPVQYLYLTLFPVCICPNIRHGFHGEPCPRVTPFLPAILNVEFFFIAAKACNGQSSSDESTTGHQQRS